MSEKLLQKVKANRKEKKKRGRGGGVEEGLYSVVGGWLVFIDNK